MILRGAFVAALVAALGCNASPSGPPCPDCGTLPPPIQCPDPSDVVPDASCSVTPLVCPRPCGAPKCQCWEGTWICVLGTECEAGADAAADAPSE